MATNAYDGNLDSLVGFVWFTKPTLLEMGDLRDLVSSALNLKQIGLALHYYNAEHEQPATKKDPDAKDQAVIPDGSKAEE